MKCSYCDKDCEVINVWENGYPKDRELRYINPQWQGYEDVCNFCRQDDIQFQYRKSRAEHYESNNKPVPEWVWQI